MTDTQKDDILKELEGDGTVDGGKEFVSAHHLPATSTQFEPKRNKLSAFSFFATAQFG